MPLHVNKANMQGQAILSTLFYFCSMPLFGSLDALMSSYLRSGRVGVNSSSRLSVVILAGGLPSRLM